MRRGAALLAAAVLGSVSVTARAQEPPGQNTLDEAALSSQAQVLAEQRLEQDWLRIGDDSWALYCERPATASERAGPNGLIQAYILARGAAPQIDGAPLQDADMAGGLIWAGVISYVAEASREYDRAGGWRPWRKTPLTLEAIQVQDVQGQWVVEQQEAPLAGKASCRRPEPSEVGPLLKLP
jgi:hypothetical protein